LNKVESKEWIEVFFAGARGELKASAQNDASSTQILSANTIGALPCADNLNPGALLLYRLSFAIWRT
jgi:hypothetical protein